MKQRTLSGTQATAGVPMAPKRRARLLTLSATWAP